MQTSFQPPAPLSRQRALYRLPALGLMLALCVATNSDAQTLARPGWAGSGLNADPWWKQAVFYQISPAKTSGPGSNPGSADDFKVLAARLDLLKAVGVDALLLPMPVEQAETESSTTPAPSRGASKTIAPLAPGPLLDAFDELINQASRQNIRVVLDITASSLTPDLPATARFWLNRGVAGFHLTTPPETSPDETQAIVQALHKVTDSGVGQRILIGNFDANQVATPNDNSGAGQPYNSPAAGSRFLSRSPRTRSTTGPDRPQLQIDSRLSHLDLPEAANLRAMLVQTMEESNILVDINPPSPPPGAPVQYSQLAKVMAAVLLTTHPAALLDSDAQIGLHVGEKPDSLANWYRSLSALHHANTALRYGTSTLLNFDEQNALVWVNRPPANAVQSNPIVVACNLSGQPVQLALSGAIHNLDMRGSYLRTILRSDDSFGPQDINAVILPPYGVYIGELRR
jgi:alpha-glucosidase